jgi:hypothetical protein
LRFEVVTVFMVGFLITDDSNISTTNNEFILTENKEFVVGFPYALTNSVDFHHEKDATIIELRN